MEKAGIVGAFCRTYGIRDAIDKFLKECSNDEFLLLEGLHDAIIDLDLWEGARARRKENRC